VIAINRRRPCRTDLGAFERAGTSQLHAAARWRLADQSGTHDRDSARGRSGLGKLLGVAHVRTASRHGRALTDGFAFTARSARASPAPGSSRAFRDGSGRHSSRSSC
jgi:hypothetical protein